MAAKKYKVSSKRSTRINEKSRRKRGKKGVFPRLQGKTKRKSARFYFRSRKPSFAQITDLQRTVVLSLDASRGRPRELLDGSEIVPFLQKIRAKLPSKRCDRESVYAVLSFEMESGKIRHRTIMVSKDHPNVARVNNKALAQKIDEVLKEGASKTKTYVHAYLTTVTVKRFYDRK